MADEELEPMEENLPVEEFELVVELMDQVKLAQQQGDNASALFLASYIQELL